ncbi:MAG TPA: hypothetical protein VLL75_10595 [Vicinamibacteria bacterium]|nr:hypothetical protein [Vicinamibacteria bacterium]
MRSRVLLAALGIVALAALALGRGPARRPAPSGARRPTAPRAEAPSPAHSVVDPEAIRDLFHFEEEYLPQEETPAPAGTQARDVPPEPPPGPRLVGLVSRGGRRLAALAAEGEVVLAGPGDTAAGVTVLAVDDEGVRIRRADGGEETLVLP